MSLWFPCRSTNVRAGSVPYVTHSSPLDVCVSHREKRIKKFYWTVVVVNAPRVYIRSRFSTSNTHYPFFHRFQLQTITIVTGKEMLSVVRTSSRDSGPPFSAILTDFRMELWVFNHKEVDGFNPTQINLSWMWLDRVWTCWTLFTAVTQSDTTDVTSHRSFRYQPKRRKINQAVLFVCHANRVYIFLYV